MYIYHTPNIFEIDNEIEQMKYDEQIVEVELDDEMIKFMNELGLIDGIDYKSIL